VDDVLAQAGSLAGKTVMTCLLPMSKDDSRLVIGHSSSGAEELARKLPRAHVVSAFGTVPSEVLDPVFAQRPRGARPDLLFCGDNVTAKRTVARLIRDAGFKAIDAGALAAARYLEPFALLVAKIAYDTSRGPRVAYRFETFRQRRA
jgi:predicted dinucleotide-binding enzyme